MFREDAKTGKTVPLVMNPESVIKVPGYQQDKYGYAVPVFVCYYLAPTNALVFSHIEVRPTSVLDQAVIEEAFPNHRKR
jgi:hypothetical protein